MKHRAVITGLGVVSSQGLDVDEFWNNISKGKSGISKIERFDISEYPSKIGGEIKNFDSSEYIGRKDAKRMAQFTEYGVVASIKALEDAELEIDESNAEKTGVLVGSGIGGIEVIEKQIGRLINRGPGRVSPFFVPMMISNMASGQISIYTGAKGPNSNTVTACASGTSAIGEASEIIKRGDADIMIAGGAEAAISPSSVAGFSTMKALSTRNDEPEKASRPFDKERDGFVIGEGSGVVIIESLENAQKRNAHIYGEISGYGMSGDAHHITQPAPEGEGAARAMSMALEKAEIECSEMDYINAHGTSTPLNDKYETIAIKNVFGNHAEKLAVSSTKSMTGHLLGAAGGVEAIICALALEHQILPPTINLNNPDPECDLDYVPNFARKTEIDTAMSNSFGFGGQNACLILTKP